MNLARIYRSDSPAGCAESKPEVFAALIQAQPLNRIADALGALERIANALEAGTGAEDPPPIGIQQAEDVQSTAPDQLHTRVGKGWIHGVVPFVPADYQVKVYDPTIATGWELRAASLVTHEDLWAPLDVDSSPLFKELPLRRSRPQS
jgi:hypothetical protein